MGTVQSASLLQDLGGEFQNLLETGTTVEEISELYYLNTLLLSSLFPARYRGLIGYAVSETPDNEDHVLFMVADLLFRGEISRIAIMDPQSHIYNYGYAGPKKCSKALLAKGVKDDEILVIKSSAPIAMPHTFTEMQFVLPRLSEMGQEAILLIAPAFHLLRAYISAVSVVIQEKLPLKLYGARAVPNSWFVEVVHSQGKEKRRRDMLIVSELAKCIKYLDPRYGASRHISTREVLEFFQRCYS